MPNVAILAAGALISTASMLSMRKPGPGDGDRRRHSEAHGGVWSKCGALRNSSAESGRRNS
jgi:hypothetical protein